MGMTWEECNRSVATFEVPRPMSMILLTPAQVLEYNTTVHFVIICLVFNFRTPKEKHSSCDGVFLLARCFEHGDLRLFREMGQGNNTR